MTKFRANKLKHNRNNECCLYSYRYRLNFGELPCIGRTNLRICMRCFIDHEDDISDDLKHFQLWSTFRLPSNARSSFMVEDRRNSFAHTLGAREQKKNDEEDCQR